MLRFLIKTELFLPLDLWLFIDPRTVRRTDVLLKYLWMNLLIILNYLYPPPANFLLLETSIFSGINLIILTLKNLRDLLETANLTQHISDPTHTSGHTLDYVITRTSDNLINSAEVAALISDHFAIHCQLNLSKCNPRKQRISYRKFKSVNCDDFSHDISVSDLVLYPSSNLDGLVMQYDSCLHDILNKHAPVISRVITVRPSRPWYSPAIAEAKRLRKRLERKWRKTRLDIDRDNFKAQRLNVINLISEAKSTYYENQITQCKDQKQMFKIVDSLLHQKLKSSLPSHTNDLDLANKFSQYFVSKISHIRDAMGP